MKKLNVVITSGGTREYIDDVRVLTNISSGALGAKIAENFHRHGHSVTYVSPQNAVHPSSVPGMIDFRKVSGTDSLMQAMKTLVPQADVVIQAMAVSDFTFDLSEAVKISSADPEAFIEHMRKTIRQTPKVISKFREWNPTAVLVGFKFTVGKSNGELAKIAQQLMEDNKLDMVLANDKAQMQRKGEHVGMLIMKDWTEKLFNKDDIAQAIYQNVVRVTK